MVKRYLSKARLRFQDENEKKKKKKEEALAMDTSRKVQRSAPLSSGSSDTDTPSECINPGCNLFGTAATAYMCSACYDKQKTEELEHTRRQQHSNNPSPAPAHRSLNAGQSTRQVLDVGQFDHNGETLRVDRARTVGEAGAGLDPRTRGGVMMGPHYGAGKSQFYAELDANSASLATSKIPTVRSVNSKQDETIFLSNSTFYKDGRNHRPQNTLSKGNSSLRKPVVSNDNGSKKHVSCESVPANNNVPALTTGSADCSTISSKRDEDSRRQLTAAEYTPTSVRRPSSDDRAGSLRHDNNSNYRKPPTNSTAAVRHGQQQYSGQQHQLALDEVQDACLQPTCQFYGSALYDGYCSKCAAAISVQAAVPKNKYKK